MSQIKNSDSLYEQDILLWSEDIVAKLKTRDFDYLDFANLIEECRGIGDFSKEGID
jgi:Domain of unknown function DUF29